jgi:all-trans-retinol 13,14-reductase
MQSVFAKMSGEVSLGGAGSAGNATTVKLVAGTAAVVLSAYGISRIITERRKVKERGTKPIARVDRALLRKKFAKKHLSTDGYDTIVIGSGMGSLSCAAILARLGKKVLVLEQHPDVAGGGTHQYDLGGYRFDSGLHYTVPWSVPVFALTCLLSPEDVTPFDIMGEADGTIDNIYLSKSKAGDDLHFKMIMNEKHIPDLYKMYPEEKDALDKYMQLSNDGMAFVKYYIFSRLLPQWLQQYYWAYIVPKRVVASASSTAEEVLPKLTSNKQLISLLSSMWIDTGARPDKASFTMTASVFRGITMEGGWVISMLYAIHASVIRCHTIVMHRSNDGT